MRTPCRRQISRRIQFLDLVEEIIADKEVADGIHGDTRDEAGTVAGCHGPPPRSRGIEDQDPPASREIDVILSVHREGKRLRILVRTGTSRAQLPQVVTVGRKPVNAIIEPVRHEDIALMIQGNPLRPAELAGSTAGHAPARKTGAIGPELENALAIGIHYVGGPGGIDGDTAQI